jgi:hypothetical protein
MKIKNMRNYLNKLYKMKIKLKMKLKKNKSMDKKR